MITFEIPLDENWVQIVNNEDYLLQNKTDKTVFLKAQATIPLDDTATLAMNENEWINSALLSGVIWAKADSTPDSVNAVITVAK